MKYHIPGIGIMESLLVLVILIMRLRLIEIDFDMGHTDVLCLCILQYINVYAPKYETVGKFWPIVHNSMIFSLVLMHVIAVGIFALKKLSIASTLMVPLPVITLFSLTSTTENGFYQCLLHTLQRYVFQSTSRNL